MNPNLKNVLAIVLAGGKGERLDPLTKHRTKPAVPFGGIYRIIDFTLSNCINSNIRKTFVLIQYKCFSLNRHLRDGWNFLSSRLGEFIEPIPPQQRIGTDWYKGTADSIFQNLYTIERENPKYVVILAGDHVYKMDYRNLLRYHIEKSADVTVGIIEVPVQTASNYGIVATDASGRINDFQEKPHNPFAMPGKPGSAFASMGIYVFSSETLYKVLAEDAANENSSHDFGKNILPKICRTHKVYGYNFCDEQKKMPRYWRDVGNIDSYFMANMDLVAVSPVFNLYDQDWPIYTAQTLAPPPKFVFAQEIPGGRLGIALDSLISNGCIISGGRVQNSVLSPNVRINSYAHVCESIIYEGVNIGRYAKIKRAIIDKDVEIPEGVEIGYDIEEDRKRFYVTDSHIVVISKGEIVKG
ncbi:MAG: glucose-1-phosphate adenylyltransferase [Planctomycetes bacterium]|nr:glucose-1-phosphate adenylyltransferase [Planctomycetota bacterium]